MSDAIVRDTVSPDGMEIDGSYQGVLAYRDGPYRWTPEQAKRFYDAGKRLYPISVEGANPHLAQVVDCENGDLSIVQAVDWAKQRNELHHDATIYASFDTSRYLVQALADEPCWLWVAWWTGKPEIPNITLPPHIRIAAVQFENVMAYDISAIVNSEWPGSPYGDIVHW